MQTIRIENSTTLSLTVSYIQTIHYPCDSGLQ